MLGELDRYTREMGERRFERDSGREMGAHEDLGSKGRSNKQCTRYLDRSIRDDRPAGYSVVLRARTTGAGSGITSAGNSQQRCESETREMKVRENARGGCARR